MPERSEREKMLAGELYRPDTELAALGVRARTLTARYSALPPDARGAARALLAELLGGIGHGSIIRPPFFCDYGSQITIGSGVFINFNCVFLDCAPIRIGDLTQIGPGVQIYTPDHPRDPELRREALESAHPVNIGANVWIGGNAIILPGVTIGDDAIIGVGSVVTRDVPAGATVAGNPARVMVPKG